METIQQQHTNMEILPQQQQQPPKQQNLQQQHLLPQQKTTTASLVQCSSQGKGQYCQTKSAQFIADYIVLNNQSVLN